jgi:hypothetical protein
MPIDHNAAHVPRVSRYYCSRLDCSSSQCLSFLSELQYKLHDIHWIQFNVRSSTNMSKYSRPIATPLDAYYSLYIGEITLFATYKLREILDSE